MKSWSVKLVLRVATLHFSNATAVDTTKKLAAPRIVGGKDVSKYTKQSTHSKDHMMKSLRRELDEVKYAIKGKTVMNLNGMLKRTDSPFTASVLECPLPRSSKEEVELHPTGDARGQDPNAN